MRTLRLASMASTCETRSLEAAIDKLEPLDFLSTLAVSLLTIRIENSCLNLPAFCCSSSMISVRGSSQQMRRKNG